MVLRGRRLGDQQPVPGRDDRVLADAEGELASMYQAEHKAGALVPDGAEGLADGLRSASTSARMSRPDSTSCETMSPACGVSKVVASVRATSSSADTAC
jgi:hypothetical protein